MPDEMPYATLLERASSITWGWSGNMCAPVLYVIDASEELIDRIAQRRHGTWRNDCRRGFLRTSGDVNFKVPLADPHQNEKIEKFEYNGYRITNFEMESSALAGLAG